MTTSREEFLENIRTRLDASGPQPEPGGRPATAVTQVAQMDDLTAKFKAALERVGGRVYVAKSAAEAREQLARILREANAKRVVWQDTPAVRALEPETLGAEWEFVRAPADGRSLRETVNAPDAGLTGADFALAETGTLVIQSRPDQPRLLSALPAVHIAVIRAGQIVPGFADLVPQLRQAVRETSNVTLVTGPSRTGDIEQTITIGAHGPRQVHVILLP